MKSIQKKFGKSLEVLKDYLAGSVIGGMSTPKKVFVVLLMVGIWGCAGKNSNSDTKNISDDNCCVFNIDFRENFDDLDVLDARSVINMDDVYGDVLKIKIKTKYEIVRAEWVTHLYPTIWSGFDDDVLQFIYLFNIEYKDVLLPLRITDNIIEFSTFKGGRFDKEARSFFKKITKAQMLNAIDRVPEEYANKGERITYACNSWKEDVKVWKRIADAYFPGELISLDNEPFDICPYETDLVVTFKGKQGEFKKIFRSEFIIGN